MSRLYSFLPLKFDTASIKLLIAISIAKAKNAPAITPSEKPIYKVLPLKLPGCVPLKITNKKNKLITAKTTDMIN